MSHIHLVTSYRKAKDFSQRFQKSASRYIFTETFRDTPSFEKLEFLRETAENLDRFLFDVVKFILLTSKNDNRARIK